jgi:signal transduction histidine kinase
MEILRTLVAVAFVLAAAVAVRLWWQRRSAPAAWLAGAFTVLALGVVESRLTTFVPGGLAVVLERLARMAVVAFPYLLFRFGVAFHPLGPRPRRAAGVLAAALMALSALIPQPAGDDVPAWYAGYVLAVVVVWTLLSTWVVLLLWRSGRGQATVARRRMRTLAVAAAVLNAALVGAGISATAGAPAPVPELIQSTALLSAGLFYVAFAPPPFVRAAWRRVDERALWKAERDLMAATTSTEVVTSMLPHISHLLGGGGALFVDRRGRQLSYGSPPPSLRDHLARDDTPVGESVATSSYVTLSLRSGRLGVAASQVTPLFGSEEVELAGWLGTLTDLAMNRAELYDLERQARARAEELTGELEALVYGISHDLRSPIVSVLGYLDCLDEDQGHRLDDEGLHFLARLRVNAEYMDRLIADLLELSRVGRVEEQPEPVELSSLAEEIAAELSRDHPAATIEVGGLPVVRMGQTRARQLLENLMANAVVHSGRPDVTVRVATVESNGSGEACIAVSDDGQGIPTPYRDKVFGLFERLESTDKDAGSGTGIGLAMCRRIVEQLGGRIWIADSDSGTDVRIQLPLAYRPPAPQTEAAR